MIYYIATSKPATTADNGPERKFIVTQEDKEWHLIGQIAPPKKITSAVMPYRLVSRDLKTLEEHYDLTKLTKDEAFLEMI